MPARRNQARAGERDVQGEDIRREGQDRAAATGRSGGARSPVDKMHVDAPKQQKNARGNRSTKHR
jgi:hypothetical protein